MSLTLIRGDSIRREIRLEAGRLESRPIQSVLRDQQNVRLVVPAHGVPDNWRIAVVGGNFPGLSVRQRLPVQGDFRVVTRIDADTLEIPNVSPAGCPPYSGGAVLQYGAPLDLTGCTARMQFRATPESAQVLAEWSTATGELGIELGRVVIDTNVQLPAGWMVTSLEVTYPGGHVKTYAPNLKVVVTEDVTR